eukprot:756010-Prorocentrum_minimum.AAC.1
MASHTTRSIGREKGTWQDRVQKKAHLRARAKNKSGEGNETKTNQLQKMLDILENNLKKVRSPECLQTCNQPLTVHMGQTDALTNRSSWKAAGFNSTCCWISFICMSVCA